jgi:hypothetical protein
MEGQEPEQERKFNQCLRHFEKQNNLLFELYSELSEIEDRLNGTSTLKEKEEQDSKQMPGLINEFVNQLSRTDVLLEKISVSMLKIKEII